MTMLSWSPRRVRAAHVGLGVSVLLLAACQEQLPTGPRVHTLAPQRDAAVAPASDIFIHDSPESWQLFMGDIAGAALEGTGRVVLVSTTAGDLGKTNPAYWQARERGEKASVEAVQPLDSTWVCGSVTFNGHPVAQCIGGNATLYFMRLADGNEIDGTGFGQQRGTLTLVRDQGTPATAMDGSTTYTSWADYAATLDALIEYESAGAAAASVRVHAPDFIRSINYADHPDALATADAVRQASIGMGWTNIWYTGYDVEFRPINLTSAQHAVKLALFSAYNKVIAAAGYGSEANDPDILRWLWRTEYRFGSPGTGVPYRGDAFVVAHEDDWQLFMGDRAQASYQAGAKMLFVYVTAGDAGYPSAYWLAREAGARASADVLGGPGAWSCATETIRAHAMNRCVKNNMVSVFLRMPDGNQVDGTGFGFGSIEQIRDQGETINSIDNATDYETFDDLSKTVAAVIDLEFDGQSAPYVNVHAQDPDTTLDPVDHPDHTAVGELVDLASAWHSWNTIYYAGYDVENRPVDLTDTQHAIKDAEFQAHDAPVVAAGFFTNVGDPEYEAWLWRTYSRQAPEGGASANRVVPTARAARAARSATAPARP